MARRASHRLQTPSKWKRRWHPRSPTCKEKSSTKLPTSLPNKPKDARNIQGTIWDQLIDVLPWPLGTCEPKDWIRWSHHGSSSSPGSPGPILDELRDARPRKLHEENQLRGRVQPQELGTRTSGRRRKYAARDLGTGQVLPEFARVEAPAGWTARKNNGGVYVERAALRKGRGCHSRRSLIWEIISR